MALEDFITDDGGPERDVSSVIDKDKLHQANLCPGCGEDSEHLRGNEYRCTTDSDECEVITYFHTDFNRNNA